MSTQVYCDELNFTFLHIATRAPNLHPYKVGGKLLPTPHTYYEGKFQSSERCLEALVGE